MKAEYVDSMGTDLSVVNAARVSFDKVSDWEEVEVTLGDLGCGDEARRMDVSHTEKRLSPADTKLINYLARGCSDDEWWDLVQSILEGTSSEIEAAVKTLTNMATHWTPFTHTAITLRMQAPVPIRTQCFKHKAGFTENEESRRYISGRPSLYVPDVWRIKPEGSVKQGSGTETLPAPEFKTGFCIECGTEMTSARRDKKYCSATCKSKHTNRHRNPYKVVFDNAKARVKREAKVEWLLDFDTMEFPEFCKFLGLKLDYSYGKGGIQDNSPSFDRIDPSGPYSPDNVQIISNKANTMKSNASPDELVKMAEQILLIYRGQVVDHTSSYESVCNRMIDLYEAMIEDGYSPEQARFVLPQGVEVQWIWTGNLASYARFYNQRTDSHAQKEIQDLAKMVGDIIEPLYPVSWKALTS